MRRFLNLSFSIFSFSFIVVSTAVAQTTQQGRVVLQSSGGRTLPGVQVMAYDAAPADTDGEGRFALTFPGKAAGDLVPLKEVYKKGYELVNRRQIERWILSPSEMVIVMAEAGKLREAREKYYGIGNSRYLAQYEATVSEIEGLKNQNRLTEVQYQDRLDEAYTRLESSQKRLEEYADRFARINRDDLSEMERRAFALVDEGRLEEAIALYESHNLMSQLAETGSARDMAEGEWREMVASLRLNADIHIFAGGRENLAKAGGIYLAIVKADPTDYDNLVTYGRFLKETVDYPAAIEWLGKAVENAPTALHVAEALLQLGETYTLTKDYDPAVKYTLRSIELFDAQAKSGEAADLCNMRGAFAYSQLGAAYYSAGDMENAARAIATGRQLNDSYTVSDSLSYIKNRAYLDGIGVIVSLRGIMGNVVKNYYTDVEQEALEVIANAKRLVEMEDNIENRIVLSAAIANLGAHYFLKELDPKAVPLYLEAIAIDRELARRNPMITLQNMATKHSMLSGVYWRLGDTANFEEHNAAALRLREQAYEINPKAFAAGLASSYSDYASSYKQNGDMERAKEYYGRAIAIYKSIPAEYRSSVVLELCMTICNLARLYRGEDDRQAERLLLEALSTADDSPIDTTTVKLVALDELMYMESGKEDGEWMQYALRAIELFAKNIDGNNIHVTLSKANTSEEQGEEAAAENYRLLAFTMIEDYAEKNRHIKPDLDNFEWASYFTVAEMLGDIYYERDDFVAADMAFDAFLAFVADVPRKKENDVLVLKRGVGLFKSGMTKFMLDEETEPLLKRLNDSLKDINYVSGIVQEKEDKAEIKEIIAEIESVKNAIENDE